jgi:colanic acid biosynthesis glycosyl transferase WcaI
MRVLLLTQYYAPEPVTKFTELARGLRERGHQVEVITGFPCYPQGRTYHGYRQALSRVEIIEGTRVIRVPQLADHSRSVVRRALYYLSFALAAATVGLLRSRPADVMIVYQSALPTGVAAWLISRFKRIPYVLDVADLWPESVVASGMLTNRYVVAMLRRVARFVYRGAAAINVITEGYGERIAALGVPRSKIRLIHYWPSVNGSSPRAGNAERSTHWPAGSFTVLYAGAIGPCQQLRTVVEAARLLRDRPEVQILIAGDGVERAELEREAVASGVANIRFPSPTFASSAGETAMKSTSSRAPPTCCWCI